MRKFLITFKRGTTIIAQIEGESSAGDTVTINEATQIPETEQFLERLTGLRVHIELL